MARSLLDEPRQPRFEPPESRVAFGPVTIRACRFQVPSRLWPREADEIAVVLSRGERAGADDEPEYRSICVSIERAALEQHLRAVAGAQLRGPLRVEPELDASSGAGAEIERLVLLLLEALEGEGGVLGSPLVLARLSEALMTALLLGQAHDHADLFEARPPGLSDAYVRVAEQYIEAHAHEPITTTDLARVAGVSARTLQTAFRCHRGCSPREFLKERRLERAQRRLLSAPPGLTVTQIAFDCGFQHLGQFSVDYRKRFGESPSETLRRGRHPRGEAN